MADINVGDITARLRIDSTDWQRGLQQAQQQLAQFAQQMQRSLTNVTLRIDTAAFARSLQQAQQQLTAFTTQQRQLSSVRLQIDMTAFTAGLQQATQQLQQFNTQLTTITTHLNQVRQGLQQAQGTASGFGTILQGALSVAGGLGIATSISGIVMGLKSLATEAVQAAARMEALRAQFTALQGEARAAVTLQGLFTTAQRLGVEFGTLATAFRQFDAATQGTALEGDKAQRVFEQITTGMRGMGRRVSR